MLKVAELAMAPCGAGAVMMSVFSLISVDEYAF